MLLKLTAWDLPSIYMNSRKQSGFYRAVALFFVVFIFADILFSPPCSEQFELLGIPLINVEESRADLSDKITRYISAPNSQNEQPSQSELPDDDCLSWCPHVLTNLPFKVTVQNMTALTTTQTMLFLPSPPPQSTFHPPRLV